MAASTPAERTNVAMALPAIENSSHYSGALVVHQRPDLLMRVPQER